MLANMAFKRGTDRKQTVLFPESLDEYVAADSPVRLIDAFADSLDMIALGFHRVEPDDIGADDRQGTRRVLRQGRQGETWSSARRARHCGRWASWWPGWQNDSAEAPLAGQTTLPDGLNPPRIENLEATTILRQPSRYCNVRNFKSDFSDSLGEGMT